MSLLLADGGSFVVEPSPLLVLWTLLVAFMLACGVITAAKGRWGWVAVGLLTGGIVWFVTAWLPPLPDGWWARRGARRAATE